MRLLILLSILIIPVCVNAQKDFTSDTLYVIQGKADYGGEKDLSAKVNIFSTGDKIVIEADVADDKVVVNDDSSDCDHVEVCYSLDGGGEDEYENFPLPLYYYYFDSLSKESAGWRFYKFDKNIALDSINGKKLKKDCIFYGQVHYGIFPDNRKVFWYDKSCYSLLKVALDFMPGHFDQGVKYKAEKTKSGYKVSVAITPLGLGFISVPQMDKVNLIVRVIDVDGSDDKTVLATNSLDSLHNIITFSKPLKTNVTSIPEYIYDSLQFNPTVMFTDKGTWTGVTRKDICITDSCSISEVYFYHTPFGYKKMKLNKEEIEKVSRTMLKREEDFSFVELMEENYFINKKIYSSVHPYHEKSSTFKDLKKEFLFLDGAVGLILINNEGSTTCESSSIQLKVVWIKGNENKEVFHVYRNNCTDSTLIGNQMIPRLKIEKVAWIKEGSVLMVEGNIPAKGIRKYKVSLGAGGKVSVSEVKK